MSIGFSPKPEGDLIPVSAEPIGDAEAIGIVNAPNPAGKLLAGVSAAGNCTVLPPNPADVLPVM
tara:strand:+ start:247 stop:438 length:192 start_codon:yes stop_codon:yes gene_type:complete